MAFQMPGFLARFLRPFSTSVSRPLQPDALAQKTFNVPTERAIFAGGCFWGLEKLYRDDFERKGKGLLDCKVGYVGGDMDNPSYRQVCSGTTGHAEALLVVFDPQLVTFQKLTEYFFKIHDPTTLNRQGADTGTQYRSAIFTVDDKQYQIANEIKEKVGAQWYKGRPITTEIVPAGQWWDAEDYHQRYLEQTPGGYECPAHRLREFPPLE